VKARDIGVVRWKCAGCRLVRLLEYSVSVVECFLYGEEGSFMGILDGHVCKLFTCNPNFEYQF
jgi:hypothetical protein